MMVKRFHFQKLIDLDFWKNHVKPDGWNLKKDINEINNDAILYKKEQCIRELMTLTNSNDNYVNMTEVHIYLGILFWDNDGVKESFECFNTALNKRIIEHAVCIHKSTS